MIVQKKICLLGAYAVGKTSLIRRFVERMFDERYFTTVGVRIDKKELSLDGHDVTMMVWDLAGEDDVTRVDLRRCKGASGLVFVADGCRAHTLETAVRLAAEAEAFAGSVPCVLAVNKVDLAAEWEVEESRLDDLAARGWKIVRTSAKTGHNVDPMFETLAREMLPGAD